MDEKVKIYADKLKELLHQQSYAENLRDNAKQSLAHAKLVLSEDNKAVTECFGAREGSVSFVAEKWYVLGQKERAVKAAERALTQANFVLDQHCAARP